MKTLSLVLGCTLFLMGTGADLALASRIAPGGFISTGGPSASSQTSLLGAAQGTPLGVSASAAAELRGGIIAALPRVYSADGDVNNDGALTPGDALCAFQAYLNAPNPPEAECAGPSWEIRSDVNCDSSITPGDAQCIFQGWLDGSCDFCGASKSPGGVFAGAAKPTEPAEDPDHSVSFGESQVVGSEIEVPILVTGVSSLAAFGLEVDYDQDSLEFLGFDRADATAGFGELDAAIGESGVLRVGGYSLEPINTQLPTMVGTMRFRARDLGKGAAPGGLSLSIRNAVDDLKGAAGVEESIVVDENSIPLPTRFALLGNRPNPFNPRTEIHFNIPEGRTSVPVTLVVYDLSGRVVRTLLKENRDAGYHSVRWLGKDDRGRQVSSGVYLYRIQAGDFVANRRMVLVR